MTQRYQIRFVQIPRWLLMLGGVAAVAFAVALFLLSAAVFLLVLPVVLAAGALHYLFGARRGAPPRGPAGGDVIEGEYRVIEQERLGAGREDR